MSGFIDHQAAARAGIHREDRPEGPNASFPEGWQQMDAARHDVACSENWGPVRESWGRFRITCGDCKRLFLASSKAELERRKAEHLRD